MSASENELQADFDTALGLAKNLFDRLEKLQVDYDQIKLIADEALRQRDDALASLSAMTRRNEALYEELKVARTIKVVPHFEDDDDLDG